MQLHLRTAIFATAILLSGGIAASSADASQYLWFYGTGDSAGGIFHTDGSGNILSGSGTFNTSLGTYSANISPGSGSDTSFFWDNKIPVDGAGPLFLSGGGTQETNIFATGAPAGLGTTSGVNLSVSPTNSGVYPVSELGTLTVVSLNSTTDLWFYGTGDSAGGIFNTDGSGNILSGSGTFNTSLGTYFANISPGSGSDASFFWDNTIPVDGAGPLFLSGGGTRETNIFATGAPAGIGTTSGVNLSVSPTNSGVYPVSELGTLTISPIAVPEPAAWTIMLVGFGAIGSLLRGRRRAVARA